MISTNDAQVLITLLGSDNVKRIRDVITDELIDNISSSIRYEWIFPPNCIEETINEVIDEEKDKLLKKVRKEVKEVLSIRINEFIEQMKGEWKND